MKTNLTITIKKRSFAGWLVWLLVMMPFFFSLLNDLLHLPWAIRYLMDVAWLVLLVIRLRYSSRLKNRQTLALNILVVLFLIYTLMVYIVEFQSPFFFLWGVRNNFRFFVAFLVFASFLKDTDVKYYEKMLNSLFWVNLVVTLYQFFVLGYDGDHLGGLFGTETGANGFTNMYMAIVATNAIVQYLEKKANLWVCGLRCVATLLVAALAELKFYFLEFGMIVIMASLITRFTWRKVWVLIGGISAAVLFATLLTYLFPGFAGWFSLDRIIEYATSDRGYTASGDLNRLTAIPAINELWLTNGWQRLFGLGLGNCDTSSFSFVNTPFYQNYGHMHYSWISYAFMYLECGWIGLIFYYGFFVLVFLGAHKIEKRSDDSIKTYCRLSKIMAILCMLIAVYNSSLRNEAGYMAYYVLAIPFALARGSKGGSGIEQQISL